jgi:mannose/fructose-specific phosphotransferase system component IIA
LEIAEVARTTAAAATVVRLAVRLLHRVRVLAYVTALNFPLPINLIREKAASAKAAR